jgi:hypothetical protein
LPSLLLLQCRCQCSEGDVGHDSAPAWHRQNGVSCFKKVSRGFDLLSVVHFRLLCDHICALRVTNAITDVELARLSGTNSVCLDVAHGLHLGRLSGVLISCIVNKPIQRQPGVFFDQSAAQSESVRVSLSPTFMPPNAYCGSCIRR